MTCNHEKRAKPHPVLMNLAERAGSVLDSTVPGPRHLTQPRYRPLFSGGAGVVLLGFLVWYLVVLVLLIVLARSYHRDSNQRTAGTPNHATMTESLPEGPGRHQ